MSPHEERAIALAGTIQCCYLVDGIARSGMVGQDSMAGSLESIFVTNPDNTLDVYKSGNGIRTGLRLIHEVLGEFRVAEHGDTVRYTLAVLNLEKRLSNNPEVMRAIGAGISRIHENRMLQEMPVTADETVRQLAEVYEETAGTFEPRIRVQGKQKHLQNSHNTRRIRALLLAAIRSAVLWRQLGGRLTQLVLGRRRVVHSAMLASELVNNPPQSKEAS